MLAAEIHVEFDAPAGLVVELKEAVFDDERLRDDIVPPVVQEEPLLNQKVWRDGVEMQRNGRDDRAHRAVRRDEAVEGFGDGGDLHAFQKTVAMREIRLHDGHGAGLQQTAELLLERQPFTGRDRNVHAGRHAGHAFFILRLDRLLEEQQVQIFQGVADLDGEIAVIAAMSVEKQRRIRPDGVADGFGRLADSFDGLQIAHGPCRNGEAEFERLVSGGDGLRRLVLYDSRIGRAARPTVGVDADLVADLAAEQFVDRFA